MLERLLEPVDINVIVDAPVLSQPPKADVLILRNHHPRWTPAQLERLPDGIRQLEASYILLELKYTESLTEGGMAQIVSYDTLYKAKRGIAPEVVQSFLICSHTPHKKTLDKLGFVATELPGVLENSYPVCRQIRLISLNELAKTSYNAAFKLFAGKLREKRAAYGILNERARFLGDALNVFFGVLYRLWFFFKGEAMLPPITEEELREMESVIGEAWFRSLTVEKRLQGLTPEERMKGLPPEERMKGLSQEEALELLLKIVSPNELNKRLEKDSENR